MKATDSDSGIKEASAAADVQELRVKVAEMCGWKNIRVELTEWSDEGGGGRYMAPHGDLLRFRGELPDYPNDLNACAEFEETLKGDCALWMKYMALLVGKPWHFAWEAYEVWGAVNANAEQRCRAFVKTMEAQK